VPWETPGSTALVVATPEAEPVTGGLYRLYANAGREGMFPHITLLVPFVPAGPLWEEAEARLRRVLQRFEPFDYALERLDRFPDGVLYLAPDPPGPFVELVLALISEFPEYPPYDGIHDTIVPHATVADSDDADLRDRLATQVAPRLPIACRAAEVTAVERGVDLRWRPRASYAFGELE
jgi:2'-5' RNA ligase